MKQKLLYLFVALVIAVSSQTNVYAISYEVVYNEDSGIGGANFTAQLPDGTTLGLYTNCSFNNDSLHIYRDEFYFNGAITTSSSIVIPDSVICSGTYYPVVRCENPTFSATVNALTIPVTVTYIKGAISSQIVEVHMLHETPPMIDKETFSSATDVFVPISAYTAFFRCSQDEYSSWYNVNVHPEGWKPQSITINLTISGQLGQELLKQIDQWGDVNELTVIGNLNSTDLGCLARLNQLKKLDLSRAEFAEMLGCNGLTRLREVILPSTVTIIGTNAFSGCISLLDINIPNVVTIKDNAFKNCQALASINAPQCTTIGNDSFYSCRFLSEVNLPLVRTLGDRCFGYCYTLGAISLPSLIKLGTYTFDDNKSLNSVVLSNSVETIPNFCFRDCESLTNFSFPSSLKTIQQNAFSFTSISSIDLPESVTYIEDYAFYGCPITTITIPSSVKVIGNEAFPVSHLADVYCHVAYPINTSTFYDATGATLHVPAFSIGAYRLSENWGNFLSTVALNGISDKIDIAQEFTLTDVTGLSEKPNLTLSYDKKGTAGKLLVNTEGLLSLTSYTQNMSYIGHDTWEWNGEYENRFVVYPYITGLLNYSDMRADNSTVKLEILLNKWYFISFPYNVAYDDVEIPEGITMVIARYSGKDRANMTGNTWQNLSSGETLNAYEGYIVCVGCNEDVDDEDKSIVISFPTKNDVTKNNHFIHNDVTLTLTEYASEYAHNRSWNLVGNPYESYFDTRHITFGAPITVWNGDGYTAYSLIDDNYILRPNEAFFVQAPVAETSMVFSVDGRTLTSGSYFENMANNSYSTTRANNSDRQLFNIVLSGTGYSDRARLVVNENAKINYEIECDASKLINMNNNVPQIWINDNNVKFAIDERPLGEGIFILGTSFATDGEYKISLNGNYMPDTSIELIDKESGTTIDLKDNSYIFTAKKGTTECRFVLSIANKGGITDIDNIGADAAISVEDGSISVSEKGNISIYTIDGCQIANGYDSLKVNVAEGIYIVKTSRNTSKVFVKQ